jgi:DNA polymerase elongation subunit (family B)
LKGIQPTLPQLTDTQTSELKPDYTGNTDTTEPDIDEIGDVDIGFEEQDTQEMIDTADDKDKKTIIIDEDKLDIFDVKDTSEIDDVSDLEERMKSIKPFSELVIGVLDIEATGVELSDQILAIAFDVFKGDIQPIQYRFYLSDYNNDESKMVSSFLDTLAASNIDVLVGYNIYNFDLPMIIINDNNKDRIMLDKIYNVAGVKLGDKQQQGYCIKVNKKKIEVIDAMHLVVKFDNIARDIPAQNYDLKSVAKYFGISKENRLVLGADEIRQYYYTNRKLFDEYLSEDVRETYEIFKKLAPAYYYIKSVIPFEISFFDAFRMSTAAIWGKILEKAYDDEYKNTLIPDSKMNYEGGLVIVNPGLYKNVYKVDVASLYPSIMLNYQICSKKDIKKVGLIMLKAYTKLRLELKKKAKVYGDKEADLVQNSLKLLINSLYGFYGTGGYLFNDIEAAAKIAAFGRKILKFMIDFVEKSGGVVIECDTDGIFYAAANGEEIFKGLKEELNKIGFDVELEYENCVMYTSDKKNYIIIKQDGGIVKKGSKFAGRDKSWLWTEFIVEYIKKYVNNPTEAEAYKKDIMNNILNGRAFDILKVTRKVSKNDKSIIDDAKSKGIKIEQGSIVSFVYKDYKKKKYTFDFESEGDKIYDINYYINEFEKLTREIKDVINSTKQHS